MIKYQKSQMAAHLAHFKTKNTTNYILFVLLLLVPLYYSCWVFLQSDRNTPTEVVPGPDVAVTKVCSKGVMLQQHFVVQANFVREALQMR